MEQETEIIPVPAEEDVAGLKMRQLIAIMKQEQLDMSGLKEKWQLKIKLKIHIVSKIAGRTKRDRKLSVILNKSKDIHWQKCHDMMSLINDIESKIENIPPEDSLWKQLKVVCPNYKEDFTQQRNGLRETRSKLLVTGEIGAGKTSVINTILGHKYLPEDFMCNTQAISEISYGETNRAVAHPWPSPSGLPDKPPEEIIPTDDKDFFQVLAEKIQAREDGDGHGDFIRIEIQLNNDFLRDSEVMIIDTPGVGDNPATTEMVLEHLKDAFGFLFIINTPNRGGLQEDRLLTLIDQVRNFKIDGVGFFTSESAIFLGNKWDKILVEDYQRLHHNIKCNLSQWWPDFDPGQFIRYSATEAAGLLNAGYTTKEYCDLLDSFETLIPVSSDNKLRKDFMLTANLLKEITRVFDIHICNQDKTAKKREEDFKTAIARLTDLSAVSKTDLKAFKKTLDKLVEGLVKKMQTRILDEDVLKDLTQEWEPLDFDLGTCWNDFEESLKATLAKRLNALFLHWEEEQNTFRDTMMAFQVEVEKRVSSIGKELEDLLRKISHTDLPTIGEDESLNDKPGIGWIRPFIHSMTTFQRAFFGYSAVVLFPVVAVAAVSALLYLGSVSLVSKLRNYFHSLEYEKVKKNPVACCQKYAGTLVKEYCSSKRGLREQIMKMMEPWYEFLARLDGIIPLQIQKDKELITTYVEEKSNNARSRHLYEDKRKIFEGIERALRHFQMFNLRRNTENVGIFDLNHVVFDPGDSSQTICSGFDASIHRARFNTSICGIRRLASKEYSQYFEEGRAEAVDGLRTLLNNTLRSMQTDAKPDGTTEAGGEFPRISEEVGNTADDEVTASAAPRQGLNGTKPALAQGETADQKEQGSPAVPLSSTQNRSESSSIAVAPQPFPKSDSSEASAIKTQPLPIQEGQQSRLESSGAIAHQLSAQSDSSDGSAVQTQSPVTVHEGQQNQSESCSTGQRSSEVTLPPGAEGPSNSLSDVPAANVVEPEPRLSQSVKRPGPPSKMPREVKNRWTVGSFAEQSTFDKFGSKRTSRLFENMLNNIQTEGQRSESQSRLLYSRQGETSAAEDDTGSSESVLYSRTGPGPGRAPDEPTSSEATGGTAEQTRVSSVDPLTSGIGIVSIRCVNLRITPNDIYNYLAEEKCYSRHRCPNIVKFHGACIKDNRVYHLLEALRTNLRHVVMKQIQTWSQERDEEAKYEKIREWLTAILSGLVYLHSENMTHLQLSLDTVVINDVGIIKLTNISRAKRVFRPQTLSAVTPDELPRYRYLAPEVFECEKYTSKSDMFAFGLLVWEILTGKCVFGDSFEKSLLESVTDFKTKMPLDLPTDMIRCLSADPPFYRDHLVRIFRECTRQDATITSQGCLDLLKQDPKPSVPRDRI